MDIVSATIASSLIGAVLFFVGGYLTRGLRGAAASAGPGQLGNVERDRLMAELNQAHKRAEQVRTTVADTEARAHETAQRVEQLEREAAEAGELRRRVTELEGTGAAAEAKLQALRQRAAELEQAAGDMEEEQTNVEPRPDLKAVRKIEQLERETTQLREHAAALRTKLGKTQAGQKELDGLRSKLGKAQAGQKELDGLKSELAVARTKLKGLEDLKARTATAEESSGKATQLKQRLEQAQAALKTEDERLRAENEELTQSLEQLRDETVPRQELDTLRKKQRDMLIKAQMMQQRVTEMERHADENTLLKQQIVDYDDLTLEAGELRQQVKRLEALAFSAGLKLERAETPRPPVVLGDKDATRGTAMDCRLQELVTASKSRSAVLADSQGLLLASSGEGELHEALAVLSGMIGQLGDQSCDLLPLGGLRRAELTDEHGVQLSSRLFLTGDQPLALTYVGAKSADPDPGVEKLVSSLSQIMELEGEL